MLAKILELSIRKRYFVVLLALVACVFGVQSLLQLPIDAVPDITNNQVQINTLFPSLAPEEIEKQVTFPIETALAGISGLESTRSLSRNGFSQVTAVFEDKLNIYFARQQVQERLQEAKENLPQGAEPKMGPISTGLGEIYMWTVGYESDENKRQVEEGKPGFQPDGSYITPEKRLLRGDLELASYLREIQDWIIRPQLRSVQGVAGVDVIGGYVKHYVVEIDPTKILAVDISLTEVIEALEKSNLSTGAGFVEHRGEAFVVRVSSLLTDPSSISQVIVTERDGVPIRIGQIANVAIGKELRTGSASENGQEVVVGTALMLIGANSRTVAKSVDAKIKEIRSGLPSGVELQTVLNRTKLVDSTIATVKKNLLEGAILVIVVLFVLLGNIRAALIAALAIPVSMLLTAIGMVESKISGNLMSLGAIDFGLIVDGAVIIVENCLRRLAEKQHHLGRALKLDERLNEVTDATREMIQPSVFGQAIIVTVYIPILFLTGIEGKMFQPMAITVILALVAAFILSLTLIPAVVALAFTGKVSEKEVRIIELLKSVYGPALNWVLGKRAAIISLSAALFFMGYFVFIHLGQEFIPTLDEKDIALHALRIPSTGIAQSTEMQVELEKEISKFPEVQFVFSKTGTAEIASDPMPPNVSDTFVILKAKKAWPNPGEDKASLIARIQEAVLKVPGNNYEFTQPIQMRFNELISGVRGDVAVKVFGEDFEALLPFANEIAAIMREVTGNDGVKVEQIAGLPFINATVDLLRAGRLGLRPAEIHNVISAAIRGQEAGFILQGDRRFDIVVRYPEEFRSSLSQMKELPIPVKAGHNSFSLYDPESDLVDARPKTVPLSEVADIKVSEGPNQVSRENGKRRIVVQTNIRGRDIGSYVEEVKAKINEKLKTPPGVWISWGGQFENLQKAKERLLFVVPLCLVLILILLYSTFGSVKDTILVFTAIPLALPGGVFALWLRGMPFSISAAVGFIALSGVAVLNGLVLVSFINSLATKIKIREAIYEGALTRLRPVLTTALVASLGFLPMALASGTGAEVQRPLATVVIGGLITATALTLFVLPALYSLFHKDSEKEGV
jgi:cobalt-zinc-cadmium resistance protein CzcA